MKQKSPEQKRQRSARYKAAINPLREMFGCTAAQCAGCVQSVIQERNRLVEKVTRLEQEQKELKNEIEDLKERLEAFKLSAVS